MKYYTSLALLLFISGCALAQTIAPQHQWNVTLQVVDEDGNPVFGANASVGYFVNSQPASSEGLTDGNGVFTASHTADNDLNELGFTAEKTGYYTTRMGHMLFPPYDPAKWDITQTIVLKKIGQPIPMYARWIRSEPGVFKKTGKLPIVFNTTIGYDLVLGDWVAPYGTGVNTDLKVTEEFNKQSALDYDFKLTISFPKAGDGIQEFTVPDAEKESDLRSPHEAPTNGYNAQLVRENFHHPGQAGQSDYDPNRNYFFRVRTVLDHQGNVVSTHYGKIYGDPEQMSFEYYLNPTPNDRNIEFDPKQNLLGGLKPFEQVNTP
jgi:hypothetical protein